MQTVTLAERPDLDEAASHLTETFAEYNQHGEVIGRYWGRLAGERADFQFHVLGERGEVLARGNSIPVRWDGGGDDLPLGIDGAISRGFDEDGANVLCALLIVVAPELRGGGLSAIALRAMQEIARAHGLETLIAPVRPSWKERYPFVPIERYATWRRDDGLLFDPWLRTHERLGATVLRPEPQSLLIAGSVAEWESWTAMTFPESGDYWFPHGLAPVTIDRDLDRGTYWEPNVWMQHEL